MTETGGHGSGTGSGEAVAGVSSGAAMPKGAVGVGVGGGAAGSRGVAEPDTAGGASAGAASGGEGDAEGPDVKGPWWWPRRRSFVLDVLLALFSATECTIEAVSFAHRFGVPALPAAVLGFAAGTVLVVRRRSPVVVVLVALAVSPARLGIALATVGLYTLAASPVPRKITFSLAGMTTVGTFAATTVDMYHAQQKPAAFHMPMVALVLTAGTVAVGMTVAPLLLGLYIGARRRLVESLIDRADGLERELALLAEKAMERARLARVEERTWIAREMHDVVANRVSVMVVHAAALQALVGRDPQKAAHSAELLGDMGRQALDELRQMLGVLRASDSTARSAARGLTRPSSLLPGMAMDVSAEQRVPEPRAGADGDVDGPLVTGRPVGGGGQAGAGDAGQGRAPGVAHRLPEELPLGGEGPALGDVDKLVAESRAAGMTVELSVEGQERPLAAAAEHTAYRVVQEALTNVHKHAPGAQALVRVAYRTDEVAVLVENGPSDGRPSAALPSGGNGLVGMRERVVALGGGFAAGPRAGGGFRVSAMLPDATCAGA